MNKLDEKIKSITVKNEKIYTGNLILVNRKNPIKFTEKFTRGVNTGHEYNRLAQVSPALNGDKNVLLVEKAAGMLRASLDSIGCTDEIIAVSGYRSMQEQTDIYRQSLIDKGEEFTSRYVAFPGCSEHQSGLAIDLALNKADIDFICPDFPDEGVCKSFKIAAPKFGFIKRYPASKENITSISHEPWHFRYVGYPHSEIISRNDMTLEEYIDFLKDFRTDSAPLLIDTDCGVTEIYYIAADTASDTTVIDVHDYVSYQISGNNIDGFIVTLWKKQFIV